jgi:hypothetical protein
VRGGGLRAGGGGLRAGGGDLTRGASGARGGGGGDFLTGLIIPELRLLDATGAAVVLFVVPLTLAMSRQVPAAALESVTLACENAWHPTLAKHAKPQPVKETLLSFSIMFLVYWIAGR